MTLGEIAALIAALAFAVLVAVTAVPLFKLGRVLEELRLAVRDTGHNVVPILQELKGTVEATNDEIGKIGVVTEDVARLSGHATVVSENVASVSQLLAATLGGPLIRAAAIGHGVRSALTGKRRSRR